MLESPTTVSQVGRGSANGMSLGDAIVKAKSNISDPDVRSQICALRRSGDEGEAAWDRSLRGCLKGILGKAQLQPCCLVRQRTRVSRQATRAPLSDFGFGQAAGRCRYFLSLVCVQVCQHAAHAAA
jgi:hypothetical protein